MYVQVAHYRLGTGAVEELRAHVEAGPVTLMREMPGFVDYYAFDAGDGVVASVSVFEDRAGLEEAERRLEGWIQEAVERFNIEPAAVSEGPVFATPGPADSREAAQASARQHEIERTRLASGHAADSVRCGHPDLAAIRSLAEVRHSAACVTSTVGQRI